MARESKRNGQNAYLKQRRLSWYVQLAVPLPLQSTVGAKVLTKSLNTRDLATARQRRHAAIAELQNRIGASTQQESASVTDNPSASSLLKTAIELRERMSGNICRCGAYSNIVEAMTEVAGRPA